MNYPFLLRFSHISNLSDARYAAGLWADFIGFCFDPGSKDFIDPNKAKEIISWVNGPAIVGEFGHQPVDWILDICQKLNIKVIEIPQDYADLTILDKDFRIIVRMHHSEQNTLSKRADLLSTHQLEIYEKISAEREQSVLMDIADLNMDCSQLNGVSIIGQHESKPGTSNQSAWTAFLERHEIN